MPKTLTADVIDDAKTVSATVDLDGEEYEIIVKRIGYERLRELEHKEQEGELSEDEVIEEVWDTYLVEPDVPLSDVPASWVDPIMRGVYRAWGATDESIEEALSEYDPDDAQGN